MRPSRMSRSGQRPSQMSGSCREAPGCPGRPSRMSRSGRETLRMYGQPSRMSGSGQEALSDVRKC